MRGVRERVKMKIDSDYEDTEEDSAPRCLAPGRLMMGGYEDNFFVGLDWKHYHAYCHPLRRIHAHQNFSLKTISTVPNRCLNFCEQPSAKSIL